MHSTDVHRAAFFFLPICIGEVLLCLSNSFSLIWFRFCHLCRFWKIGLPPTYGLKHAAANFSWDCWCLSPCQFIAHSEQCLPAHRTLIWGA